MGDVLADDNKRAQLHHEIIRFFTALPTYRGLSLDFENLPDASYPAYVSFIHELYADLHSRNLRLYVTEGVSTGAPTSSRLPPTPTASC